VRVTIARHHDWPVKLTIPDLDVLIVFGPADRLAISLMAV
jgi:hypothetical protein